MKIGTRGSALALWQAGEVARRIHESGGPVCELVIIRTAGDEAANTPGTPGTSGTLATLNTKATFVKEIEDALADGRVDCAVHSSKDLSASLPDGLIIGAALPREDARDAVVLAGGESAADLETLARRLGHRPRIGTSSVRRAALLAALMPGASFAPMRGNVDTRLRKLDAGACDAIVLAAAGLKRLGLAHRISLALPLDVVVPAPGQGIVAVEVREDASDAARIVATINDIGAMDALTAERALVKALGGGCQMPLGAHATLHDGQLALQAAVLSPDGSAIRGETRGDRSKAAALGESLAEELLGRGAGDILGFRT